MSMNLDEINVRSYVEGTILPVLYPGDKVIDVRSVTEQTYVNWIFAADIRDPQTSTARTIYLRQSRDYVKGKPEIRMDGARIRYETRILRKLSEWIPGVTPTVLHLDVENNVAVLSDIKRGAPLLVSELRAGRANPDSGSFFGTTVATVHGKSLGIDHSEVRGTAEANAASVDFDLGMRLKPSLDDTRPYRAATEMLLQDSAHSQQCLVLGDLNSKNVFIDGDQVRFLDLERSFVGDGAFDVAFLFCHYLVEIQEEALREALRFITRFMAAYSERMSAFLTPRELAQLQNRIVRFLGVTILYRIYGFYMVVDVGEDKLLWEQRAASLLNDRCSTSVAQALFRAGLPQPD